MLFPCTYLFASPKTLCGSDDRVFSYDNKIGRLIKVTDANLGCSATMISNSCAITAGHCHNYIKILEFNVGHPDRSMQYPQKLEEDLFTVDSDSIKYQDDKDSDWAVFKVLRNSKTGKLPGELYGYYDISFRTPMHSSTVIITGYGSDSRRERTYLQQTDSGDITEVDRKNAILKYRVDTTGGSSGSAVISLVTDQIIAIHTNGGCDGRGHPNRGTLISKTRPLIKAIKACLRSE